MTTIAVKDGVMAADRMVSNCHRRTDTKINRLPDGSWLGYSAELQQAIEGGMWLALHCCGADNLPPKPTFDGGTGLRFLRLYPDGKITTYENRLIEQPINMPFYAIGSGADYAIGAMAMGASAIRAVEIAAEFDDYTGGGFDTSTELAAKMPR